MSDITFSTSLFYDQLKTIFSDVNECLDYNLNKCDHNCTKTVGGHQCSCLPGYRLVNRTKCIDKDECKESSHNCHIQAACFNTLGAFSCSCKEGFTGDGGVYCKGLSSYLLLRNSIILVPSNTTRSSVYGARKHVCFVLLLEDFILIKAKGSILTERAAPHNTVRGQKSY